LGLLLVRDGNALDTVLRPYNEGFVGGEAEPEESDGSRIETKLVRRAVAFTSQFAQRQGLLPRIEKALEAADLPLRAAEALFFYVALGLVVSVATLLFTRNPIETLIVVAIIVFLPPVTLQFLAKRRRKQFLSQLPDTLQLLAGSLRAGYSLMQGVEAVSQEVSDPMGRELRRVMVESRLGRPLEDALEDAAARMGSPDFAWAVMAIRIQREVGGNLAELLMTVAETMVSRERLRRDVKALTAEGRVSAIVLGVLPVGLGLAMYMINKKYMQTLFHDRLGNFMLGGSILMMIVGFWWMKKTVEVDV
jgi:tight adherence protein B